MAANEPPPHDEGRGEGEGGGGGGLGDEEVLLVACLGGDTDTVRDLVLGKGVDVQTCRDHKGRTALHCAAIQGSLDIVRFLVEEAKADVHARTASARRNTPLVLACRGGHLEVVRFLFACDALVGEATVQHERTPLHFACFGGQAHVARFLVEETGANVFARTANQGYTPFHVACRGGHLDCMRVLFELEPRVAHDESDRGGTALHIACRHNFDHVVRFLLDEAGLNVHAQNASGATPFQAACYVGAVACARALVVHDPTVLRATHNGLHPIHMGTLSGSREMVRMLHRELGVDVHAGGPACQTPLHLACWEGLFPCVQELDGGDKRAPPHLREECVQIAEHRGHQQIVHWLRETEGWSSLMVAVDVDWRERVVALLDEGAGVDFADAKTAATALSVARNDPPLLWRSAPSESVLPIIELASRPWSPQTHRVWCRQFREQVRQLLLVAKRLQSQPHASLPRLPDEVWLLVIASLSTTYRT